MKNVYLRSDPQSAEPITHCPRHTHASPINHLPDANGDMMRNDSRLAHADVIDPEISENEAQRLSAPLSQSRLAIFTDVLRMTHPVSTEKAAALLKYVVRDR